jgi:hypothetical protein
MEAARSFEILVSYHITTWHYNPEDSDMNLHCHENLFPLFMKTKVRLKLKEQKFGKQESLGKVVGV